MAKITPSGHRRSHQAGIGDRAHIVRVLPRPLTHGLPRAPELTDQQRLRLWCATCAHRFGVAYAVTVVGVSWATVVPLAQAVRPPRLTLAPRSRRPHHIRRATWTAAQEQAILA